MNQPAFTIHPLHPGDKLSAFTIQARIAAGGSSMVYSAVDELLNRKVAIKQLLPQVDDAAFRQRFRHEAALQRKVSESHPGLVQLIDTVEEARGVFLIMEFVQGQTLEQVLMRTGNPIDATQTLRIVWSIAQALQAIHAAGVLHRDLKPSNIIVVQADAGQPKPAFPIKIADLGVATLIAEQEAMNLGSVRYMSPELLNSEPADVRADIYSLGLIFYEMLIGRAAFQEVFKAILKDERHQAVRWMKWHTNPRAHAPRADEVNDKLPGTLGQLVARATAKDVNDRYPSAAELAETIHRHFTAQGAATRLDERAQIQQQSRVAAQAAGDTDRLPQENKRSKAVWILSASAVLTAVMIGVGLSFNRGPSAQALAAQAQAMDAGQRAFDAGRWSEAAEAYGRVLDLPADQQKKDLVPLAQAGRWAAQAKQGLADADIESASAALMHLRGSAVAEPQLIDAISSELSRKRLIARYEGQITQALDANRLGDARDALDAFYRQGLTLTEPERAVFNDLNARQIALETRVKLDHDLAEVDRLIARGQGAEAMARLRRMEARYADTVVADRIVDLLKTQRYQQGLAEGQRLLDNADLPGAIRALATALANNPDDEALSARLTGLKIREAVDRGQGLLAQGRKEAARDAFAEALGYGDSEAARQALGRLDARDQQAALIRQGDQAMSRGAYETAVNSYQAAVAVSASDADAAGDAAGDAAAANAKAAAMLKRARVALRVAEADAALAAGALEQASTGYEAALAIDPGHAPALRGAQEAARGTAYRQMLEAGDAALQRQRFGDALRAYRLAREQIDTQQVRTRIDDTEYTQLIALARGALSSEDYTSAKAYLLIARRNRASPVIDELLQLAEKGEG